MRHNCSAKTFFSLYLIYAVSSTTLLPSTAEVSPDLPLAGSEDNSCECDPPGSDSRVTTIIIVGTVSALAGALLTTVSFAAVILSIYKCRPRLCRKGKMEGVSHQSGNNLRVEAGCIRRRNGASNSYLDTEAYLSATEINEPAPSNGRGEEGEDTVYEDVSHMSIGGIYMEVLDDMPRDIRYVQNVSYTSVPPKE